MRLANAIDEVRIKDGLPAVVIIWENVPGVLNTKDNAFGCFLGGLAGEDCQLQPPGKRWENAGCVLSEQRAIAWRILDAQYFGLAQRRRRMFIVASARTDIDCTEILFEPKGMRRDTAPSRDEGKEDSKDYGLCSTLASGSPVTGTIMANAGTKLWLGNQEAFSGHYHVVHGTQDPITQKNCSFPLGRNNGQENAIAIAGNTIGRSPENGGNGLGLDESGVCYTLTKADRHGVATTHPLSVRRLTPIECERLQGFRDNYTQIPWQEKPADQCPDGLRYQALGNSMPVNVMHWIGKRIDKHLIKPSL